jgi:signal transduction histidine kinase
MTAADERGSLGFSVDTHLFRELGELLVGRDSTALIELVKNSYDADALEAFVTGTDLARPDIGGISIADNGVGMTEEEFRNGFLRIASRGKNTSTRRSVLLGRRFTGEKGVGRLAAHKLARTLSVDSQPHQTKLGGEAPYRIRASIDWDEVERHETLDQAVSSISFEREPAASPDAHGTRIELRGLRRPWGSRERIQFFDEMSTFEPPALLAGPLPRGIAVNDLLFDSPLIRDANGPGMAVKLSGDLEAGDDPAAQFGGFASWILEVVADETDVHYAVAPTRAESEVADDAGLQEFAVRRQSGEAASVCFQARVLIATKQPPRALRETLRRTSGVRVYLEGFRVLPYGEPGDDWLEIQRSYVSRSRFLDLEGFGDSSPDEGLSRPPVDQVFGAVFLTDARSPGLKLLVNREGFVPGPAYEELRDVVRRGIDIATRVRAQATAGRRAERSIQRRHSQVEKGVMAQAPAERLQIAIREAGQEVTKVEAALADGDADEARERLRALSRGLQQSQEASEDVISQSAMLRALASLGTQMAEFVHELNEILGSANALDELADALVGPEPPSRDTLQAVVTAVGDLRRALERQAILLIDVITPDARRRRSRQRLADRFTAAAAFVADAAGRRGVSVVNDIPSELRSPPMFPAEVATVMTNLLTNAVKAAGTGGVVRGTAGRRGETVVLRVENTGDAINVAESEQWFAPFASTTAEIDSTLGQGMGLGLTLTRAMLAPYRSKIEFVEPSPSFATAVEVTFPA